MRKTFLALSALGAALSLFAAAPTKYLEYIESDASKSQYIDLGVEGKCYQEIEAEVAYVAFPNDGGFIGCRNSGDTRFYALHYYGGVLNFGYRMLVPTTLPGMLGAKYALDVKFMPGAQTMSLDGNLVASRSDSAELSTGRNLFVFATNNSGNPNYFTSGRLYSLKVWNLDANGERTTLAGDYRPCLDANDVPCLYDAVSDACLYNGGSGSFAYAELPAADAPTVDYYVEYVETDGSQYVDTGVLGQTGLGATLQMSFTEVPSDGGILCAFNNNRIYLAYYYPGNKGFYNASGSSNVPALAHEATAGTMYTIQSDIYRDYRNFWLNGEEVGPNYTSDNQTSISTTLHLFGRSNAGTSDYRSKMRLYSCTIVGAPYTRNKTDALVTVRDFHPCVDTAGVAGLYDTVSGRIFYPAIGNALAAGPALATAARVVASDSSEFPGTASPAYGTDSAATPDAEETYACAKYFTTDEGVLFMCTGYTTATSTDGSVWSAESALVASREATLTYPGGWWRLTWHWQTAGYRATFTLPEGAMVVDDAETGDFPAGCYPASATVSFTASATDGAGNTFVGWSGDVPSGVFDTNRTLAVSMSAAKSLVAHYRHAWTLVSESAGVKTITDGNWTVEVEDGVVGRIAADGIGPLDFTSVEQDLGFKVTAFKTWEGTSHQGPANLTRVVAPDVTEVGNLSFNYCRNLESAVFSPSLRRLGRSAFYNCQSLVEISPAVSAYLSQCESTSADLFVFGHCAKLAGDLVVAHGKSTLYLPDWYFNGTLLSSADFSRCRGTVDFTTYQDAEQNGTFRYCSALGSVTLPPDLASLPRGLFWGCSSLTNLYVTGALPALDRIGMFYSLEFHKLRVYISQELNPTVVSDLELREPTAEEMTKPFFPRAEYESGKLLGVWHTDETLPNWGALDWGGRFCPMWVIDWQPPRHASGLVLFVR
ncbi:MAG: leucine-rich repeat protein [Kiritimatiellae bacterium]|nr:leucine-rich repeat protein [Kiritimatiellia bacterium]